MALPPHSRNKQLLDIEQFLEANPLSHVENLSSEDLQLIGGFVQMYNCIEYNLRRSIAVLAHAKLVTSPKKLNTSELVKIVKDGVAKMGLSKEDVADTFQRLDEIESRRDFRNLLAHWAAKRIIGNDALLLLSQDNSDLLRATGACGTHQDSGYCIVSLADLRGLIKHLLPYEQWIADKTSEWHLRYCKVTS